MPLHNCRRRRHEFEEFSHSTFNKVYDSDFPLFRDLRALNGKANNSSPDINSHVLVGAAILVQILHACFTSLFISHSQMEGKAKCYYCN